MSQTRKELSRPITDDEIKEATLPPNRLSLARNNNVRLLLDRNTGGPRRSLRIFDRSNFKEVSKTYAPCKVCNKPAKGGYCFKCQEADKFKAWFEENKEGIVEAICGKPTADETNTP